MMPDQTQINSTHPTLLLSPTQAAKALSISERTLWAMTVPRGPLPAVKIGRRGVRYAMVDLQAWIESQKRKSEPS
jgi:excisionase family DNA binding protein